MIQRRRGAALVEMALTLPLLVLLLLGIVEFGMIMHDKVMLDHAASEGARAAAMGQSLEAIVTQVRQASMLPITGNEVLVQYRDASTGGQWASVSDSYDSSGNVNGNMAPPKSMVQVTLQGYPHPLVTGSFFAWLPGCHDGVFPLSASLATQRE